MLGAECLAGVELAVSPVTRLCCVHGDELMSQVSKLLAPPRSDRLEGFVYEVEDERSKTRPHYFCREGIPRMLS